jgi:signal transduction histidine kinase
LYATLFLASGAGLLAITYVLVNDHTPTAVGFLSRTSGRGAPAQIRGAATAAMPSSPPPGVCLTITRSLAGPGDGAIAFSGRALEVTAKTKQCATWVQAQVNAARSDYLTSLLTDSGIALALMAIAALGLGWLVSGRVLRPLRTITLKAQQISASNLHERLALSGPEDELTDLGNTMDGLLARLETAFAAQRQFVANASHELRTPLARQRTMVEVALADPDRCVDSLAAACRRVLAAGQQQERLIEGLLTLARSQRGLDRIEPVDLAAIAREAVLSRSSDAHHGEIQLTMLDGPAAFPGDARLAERLVTNLLDNAIRHNYPGGCVLVRTWTAAAQAVIAVVNTGPVITPMDAPYLFEPFRRCGQARVSSAAGPVDAAGVGLGLSIVAAIANAHSAGLHASPQADGGLTVEVRFHCAVDRPPAEQPALVGQPQSIMR